MDAAEEAAGSASNFNNYFNISPVDNRRVVGRHGFACILPKRQNTEQGSYAAQLYLNRCGQCHQAYNPSLMTAPMWAVKVDLMQERMKQTGLAPLTPDERKTILEYLSSNAGQQ